MTLWVVGWLGDLPVYRTVRTLWVVGWLGDLPVYHTVRSLWVLGQLGDLPAYTTAHAVMTLWVVGWLGDLPVYRTVRTCWVSWETSLTTTQSGPVGLVGRPPHLPHSQILMGAHQLEYPLFST